MRGLDLFAGIGLFGEGMRRAGVEVAGFCELADWKRKIHRELHGALPEWHDIRDMRGDDVLGRAGPIDIIFGSPPCTDASLANSNGKGISGSETGLFMEAIRIVREIRPDWIALENVPGLRTRGADGVLTELEQEGYAVWPLVVGADNLGAPHIRKRVWIVGYAKPAGEQMGRGGQSWQADVANPDSPGIRQQPRRGSGPNGQGAAVVAAEATAHPDRQGQQRQPVYGEVAGGASELSAEPSGSGLAFWESLAGDHGAQLAALERDIGPAIHEWAGGLCRYLQLADGCPAKTARMLMSACGDGVVVSVATAIGRAIVGVNHFTAYNGND